MFYVYILKSLKNNSLYIGYTADLKRRFKQHNKGEIWLAEANLWRDAVRQEVCESDNKIRLFL